MASAAPRSTAPPQRTAPQSQDDAASRPSGPGSASSVAACVRLLAMIDEIMPIANRLHIQSRTQDGHAFYWNVATQESSWVTPELFEEASVLAAKLAQRFDVSDRLAAPAPLATAPVLSSAPQTVVAAAPAGASASASAATSPLSSPRSADGAFPIYTPDSDILSDSASTSIPSNSNTAARAEGEGERRRRASVAAALLGGDASAALEVSRALVRGTVDREGTLEEEDEDAVDDSEDTAASAALRFDEADSSRNVELDASGVPRAATFAKLIEHLTAAQADAKLAQDLLLTYRSLCAPRELLAALVLRVKTAQGASAAVVHLRAINVLRLWLDQYWADFSRDRDVLAPLLRQFHVDVRAQLPALLKPVDALLAKLDARLAEPAPAPGASAPAGASSAVSPRRTVALVAPLWSASAAKALAETSDACLALLGVDALELARQLSLAEWELWSRVQASEFLDQAWTKEATKRERAPNIVALIEHFNAISGLVQSTLLRAPSPKERARVVTRWLEVLAHLRALNNFNGMLEVVSALNASSVHRLAKTWAQLGKKEAAALAEATALVASADNYKALRHALSQAQPPCLPYLGMYLTDLVFIEEGNKSLTRAGLINFHKRRLVAAVLREVAQYQQDAYALAPVPELHSTLKAAVMRNVSEKRRYDLSLVLEPRAATINSDDDLKDAAGPASAPELFDSKELEKVLKRGQSSAPVSASSSKDMLKKAQGLSPASPTSPRRAMSAAPLPTPQVLSTVSQQRALQTQPGVRVESQGQGFVLAVNDTTLLRTEDDEEPSALATSAKRSTVSPPASPRTLPAPSLLATAPSGAQRSLAPRSALLTTQPTTVERAHSSSQPPAPVSPAGAAGAAWFPPLQYTPQHYTASQALPRRVRRLLVRAQVATDAEAAALTGQGLADLAQTPALSTLTHALALAGSDADAALTSARTQIAQALTALRDAVDEMETVYVRPLAVARVLNESQQSAVFGGVSDLAFLLAASTAHSETAPLPALLGEIRGRLLPALAQYTTRFEAANAALAECARNKAFMEWLASLRAVQSESEPRSLREVRASPLAALLPLLISLLGLTRTRASTDDPSVASLLSDTVAVLTPLALDGYEMAQSVLFAARFVEMARDSHALPKKLVEEKMSPALRHKAFFRRQGVVLESARKPGRPELAFAYLYSGFVLVFSDERKLKFVECIELSPLSTASLDPNNSRRVVFTAVGPAKEKEKDKVSTTSVPPGLASFAIVCDEAAGWAVDLIDASPESDEANTSDSGSEALWLSFPSRL